MNKPLLIVATLMYALFSHGQAPIPKFFVPSQLVGNSNNNNIGINVTTPLARLDLQTDAYTGGIQLRTAAGEGFGGYSITPYAFRIQHTTLNPTGNPVTADTYTLFADGKLQAGNFQGITSTTFISTRGNGFGAYNTNQKFVTLSYGNAPSTGALLNWKTDETNPIKQNFAISYDGAPKFHFTPEGKLGIGTNAPTTALTILVNNVPNVPPANPNISGETYGLQINSNGWRNQDFAINVNTAMGNVFRLTNNGYLYLGQNLNGAFFGDYRLYVETGIRTEKIRVDIAADNGWADFVFDDDYEMMSIAELQAYIKTHKHLPNVPSEAQVREEGIDLAEMNAILLRQIEELTLRVIELEKKLR